MIKKIIIGILLLATVVAGGFIINFYWKNLRGIWPAIKSPAEDISRIIKEQSRVEQAINNTSFPLKLPPNFSISIFAENLGGPRVMTYDYAGNIITSIPSQGKVVALPDKNSDGIADEVVTVVEGLNRPHGLITRCTEKCEFYIAETDKVAVYDYDAEKLKAFNKRKIIDLPGGGNHFTRTILFLPEPNDHKLLTSIGSSCDTCEEKDWRRGRILISNADGSDLKEFVKGLRNSVFMAIHPVTGKIWATEMGRDFLGDDLPPDEINIIEEGQWYGWPWFYGKNIEDYEFSPYSRPLFVKEPQSSYIDIPAHSAPLGLAFFPEEGWPEEYWHNLLVVYHGSWNRTEPTGYKIARYKLDSQGNYFSEEDFISGWLQSDGTALGRPVDILIQPGGVMYISDDKAGVIYRIIHNKT
ncbi:MAG: L-sorbosone dehydrogenase [Parcubacteria group bacterium GW2011_GWE2_37_8]|nr:MAG: L-sorbosone dehydrogenase [Parcubacteria group bacterium GW2011_GWE2_37_8]